MPRPIDYRTLLSLKVGRPASPRPTESLTTSTGSRATLLVHSDSRLRAPMPPPCRPQYHILFQCLSTQASRSGTSPSPAPPRRRPSRRATPATPHTARPRQSEHLDRKELIGSDRLKTVPRQDRSLRTAVARVPPPPRLRCQSLPRSTAFFASPRLPISS